MSTDHLPPSGVPAGSELRPTVAQPPALAAGAAIAATASTSRSFFMRTLQSGVTTPIHPPFRNGSLLDRSRQLERLGARQVSLEPEQQLAPVPEQHGAGKERGLVRDH